MTRDSRGHDHLRDFFSLVDQLGRLIGIDVFVAVLVRSASPTVWCDGIHRAELALVTVIAPTPSSSPPSDRSSSPARTRS